jgi:hypothetical protein
MSSSAIFLIAVTLCGQTLPLVTEVGRVSGAAIQEASALEASRRYPDVYWTVPDSGNPPHLVAIDGAGKVLARYRIKDAVNLDWECLALDQSGRLFICDVGNNAIRGKSRLLQRWVYVVREPDPRKPVAEEAAPGEPPTLPLERTLLVRYPEGPFDIEAALAFGEAVYFISKTDGDAAVYRLPWIQAVADSTASNDEDTGEEAITLEKILELPGLRSATGASLSPDGRLLAVSTYTDVWLYRVADRGAAFSLENHRPARRLPFRAPGVEACSWDGRHLLLLSESGTLYRLRTD